MALTPTERSLLNRAAALDRWSREPDRKAATEPARRGRRARIEKEIDPDGRLAPDELARRVDSALRAEMIRLSLRSARVRARARTS